MYQPIKKIDAHVHLTSLLFAQDVFQPPENPLDGDCIKVCLRRMEEYHIDQCVALFGQGIDPPGGNEINIKMAEMLPEKIAGVMAGFEQPPEEPWNYNPQKAADQMERYMKHSVVKGMGELAIAALGYMAEWPEVWSRLRPVFDVLAAHNAPCLFHTGPTPKFDTPLEKDAAGKIIRRRARRETWFSDPLFIDDIAEEYPDIPLIIGHAGVQGYFYYGSYVDHALIVAARHKNVYIETSSVPYEVLVKCVEDPAIGPEKLIFGTDTPAFYGYYKSASTGEYYPSYGKTGPGEMMTDHYPVDLANIERLPITDRQRQMIMGGTMAGIMSEKHE